LKQIVKLRCVGSTKFTKMILAIKETNNKESV
jgi:hypothetical protein